MSGTDRKECGHNELYRGTSQIDDMAVVGCRDCGSEWIVSDSDADDLVGGDCDV